MDITVNVEKISLDDYIGSHFDEDGDRTPAGTLGDAVIRQLVDKTLRTGTWKGVIERIQTIRDEEIRAQVAPVIAEALSADIHRTNTYGEKAGQTTTLRELIAAEAKRYLAEPSDSYSRNKGTRLQAEVRKAVTAAFQDEIAGAVKEVRDAVAGELGTNVSTMVSAAMNQALAKR